MVDYPELAMHIDGEWVGAATAIHQVRQPGHRPGAGRAAAGRRRRPRPGAGRRRPRLQGLARHAGRRAGRVLKKAADLMRERPSTSPASPPWRRARPSRDADRVHVDRQLAGVAGEEARRAYGRVLVRPRACAHGAEGAGRPGGRLRALELPGRATRPQARRARSPPAARCILKAGGGGAGLGAGGAARPCWTPACPPGVPRWCSACPTRCRGICWPRR